MTVKVQVGRFAFSDIPTYFFFISKSLPPSSFSFLCFPCLFVFPSFLSSFLISYLPNFCFLCFAFFPLLLYVLPSIFLSFPFSIRLSFFHLLASFFPILLRPSLPQFCLPSLFHSISPFPSLPPSFPSLFLPSFLPFFPPFLLLSFLPLFMSSYLLSPLSFLLPSFLSLFLSSYLHFFSPFFPSSLLNSLIPAFLPSLLSPFPPSFLHIPVMSSGEKICYMILYNVSVMMYCIYCILLYFTCRKFGLQILLI